MKNAKFNKLFNILGYLKFVFIIFAVFVLFFKSFKIGADFKSGHVIHIYAPETDGYIQNIKVKLEKAIDQNVELSQEENSIFIIKFAEGFVKGENVKMIAKKVILTFEDATILKIDSIGPKMSKSFAKESVLALLFAISFIFVYVLLRFNLKFAVAGILSLLYDIILALSIMNLANIEFNLITITAVLTIIGYCINDKIVVFDRIRHNIANIKNNISILEILRQSINQVLIRSIMTSFATFIATFGLFFFKDHSIRNFSILVMSGIFFGTYSSLFVAPWLLQILKLQKPKVKNKDMMFYAS